MIKSSGGRVVGRSHLLVKSPCQDDFSHKVKFNSGCIALADGAGSKFYSHLGAKIVTRKLVEICLSEFDKIDALINDHPPKAAEYLVDRMRKTLSPVSVKKKIAVSDMACTLIFFSCKEGRYIAGHIGDGVLFLRNDGKISVLSEPQNGEYANSTYFVTDSNAASKFRVYSGLLGRKFGVMAMSDGSAESLWSKQNKTPSVAAQRMFEWFDRMPIRKMNEIIQINLEQVIRQKTTDDCSLVMMTNG